MATIKQKHLKARLARMQEDYGLTPEQTRRLSRLANIAGTAQEAECNINSDVVRKIAEQSRIDFEITAKALGFETRWPGLYPNLFKDGRWIELPLDLID
jgi:cytochrome c-type biogenesis protein CcmE